MLLWHYRYKLIIFLVYSYATKFTVVIMSKVKIHTTNSGIKFYRQRNHGIEIIFSPDSEIEKGLLIGDILTSLKMITGNGTTSNIEQV